MYQSSYWIHLKTISCVITSYVQIENVLSKEENSSTSQILETVSHQLKYEESFDWNSSKGAHHYWTEKIDCQVCTQMMDYYPPYLYCLSLNHLTNTGDLQLETRFVTAPARDFPSLLLGNLPEIGQSFGTLSWGRTCSGISSDRFYCQKRGKLRLLLPGEILSGAYVWKVKLLVGLSFSVLCSAFYKAYPDSHYSARISSLFPQQEYPYTKSIKNIYSLQRFIFPFSFFDNLRTIIVLVYKIWENLWCFSFLACF